MTRISPFIALSALVSLAACDTRTQGDAEGPDPSIETPPSPEPTVSILRPDIEQPELPPLPLEPLNITIGFPAGGTELDAAATAALESLLISEQVTTGGAITLRAHSDASGSDAVNERASQARGDKVRDWLIDKGIAEERITVIAFGEQNPIEPNALPDGSPNEAGRAANRRVDVEVTVIEATEPAEAATSAPVEPAQ